MDRHNIIFLFLYKCIMANTSAIWQQAAHTTYQLSSPSCSTRAIQKSLTLKKNYEFSGKKSGEWTISRKMTRQKEQEDLAGKKTREEIGNRNQMTALRFQTGEGHQTSSASLPEWQQILPGRHVIKRCLVAR